MRTTVKHLFTFVAFVLIFAILFARISTVVSIYNENDCDRKACLFFELPKNSVDCLMLGSSHVYCTYIPKILYDDYGITSADLATSAQSYQNSYYLLKEAFLRQNPKVVLLDINNLLCFADVETLSFRLHFTSGISNLPDYSFNKLTEYMEMKSMNYGYSHKVDFSDAYGFWTYKNEFNRGQLDLSKVISLFINPVAEYDTFGYWPVSDVRSLEKIDSGIDVDEGINLFDTIEFSYFLKIIDLVKENNADLIMVRSPYYSPDANSKGLYSQSVQFLQENDISYINFFELSDEIDLDLNTDFYDDDHLNVLGATKTTKYLGEYLSSNYRFEDRRCDRKTYLWRDSQFDYEGIVSEANEKASSMGY